MRAKVLRIPQTAVSLSDAAKEYLHDCEARNLSVRTIETNAYAFRSLTRFLGEDNPPVESITPANMREYFAQLRESIKAPTIRRYHATLSCFFQFCEHEGYIARNPMADVSSPKVPEKPVKPLNATQVQKLLEACGSDFAGIRDRALVMTLYDCGLRATELCQLTDADIDWSERVLLIRQTKNGHSRRVPFGEVTAKALRGYLTRRGELETDRLFVNSYGGELDANRLRKILVRLAEKAEVSGIHPHIFRHSFAVAFLRNGGDVFTLQKMLGHRTLEMTRHYSLLADTDMQAKHRLYSPADKLAPVSVGRRKLK